MTSPKTVLCAWELGSGLGHVAGLRLVAKRLAEQGTRIVFAAPDVVHPLALLKQDGFPLLQAPCWPLALSNADSPFGAGSYADILAVHGYTNPDHLLAMVVAWQRLFEIVKPDLIVADHCPTLCLAARERIPVVLLGNGFALPPTETREFPALRSNTPPAAPQKHILAVIREVQKRIGQTPLETLPQLLATQARFVCSFPELDPYAKVRQEPLFAPVEALPSPSPLPASPSAFAYIAPEHDSIEALVLALRGLNFPVSVYFRGPAGAYGPFLRTQGIQVYSEPPPFEKVIREASAVISHANHITAHAALMAGRPQVLLPLYLEMQLTAQALGTLGVATLIERSATPESLVAAIEHATHDERLRTLSQAWANGFAERRYPSPLDAATETCLRALG